MADDNAELRTQFYNRLARRAVITFLLSFGALLVLVVLPVSRGVGMTIAPVAVLVLIIAGIVLVYAVAARDLPIWKQNRWRFSMGTMLTVMANLAILLGVLTALVRGASGLQLLVALCLYILVSAVVYTIYSHRSRTRHFNEMHADGRYMEWDAVAERLTSGEGTALVGKCYQAPTLWWTDRKIASVDEAQAAIDADAFITICPKQRRIPRWLKATFPEAPVIELAPTFFGLQSKP